jgi:threonine synthase
VRDWKNKGGLAEYGRTGPLPDITEGALLPPDNCPTSISTPSGELLRPFAARRTDGSCARSGGDYPQGALRVRDVTETGSLLEELECRACGTSFDAARTASTCPTCGQALFATYDLSRLAPRPWLESLTGRASTLWRYRELLPVRSSEMVTTLGEGFTPVISLGEVEGAEGVEVLLKDDGSMPTGSFKARGMAVAVSRAKELGLRSLYVPSAGNAGVALAAYAARAGVKARVYLPERTPTSMIRAVRLYGGEVVEVRGTIREAGEAARTQENGRGSFDLSTLREPYRVEGKKTMGFEVFEQSGPEGPPDAIVYPTGGGTGLVGMAKAFSELSRLGLVDRTPRLYAVQPDGCAPVARALAEGATRVTAWLDPHTIAPGLLVPSPFSSERVLEAVRSTKGGGVTVTDREILTAMTALAARHGVSASPEGAAPYAALPKLLQNRSVRTGERVLLYNTGTGLPFSVETLERGLQDRTEGTR